MSLLFSGIGVMTFAVLFGLLLVASRQSPLGALSLPSTMALTALVYFFTIPAMLIISGETTFFGLSLISLELTHLAIFLYALGAVAAFVVGRRYLVADPLSAKYQAYQENPPMFWLVLIVAFSGIFFRYQLNQIGGLGNSSTSVDSEVSGVNFLNLSYSLLIGLALYQCVKRNFDWLALLFITVTLFLFVLTVFGFEL